MSHVVLTNIMIGLPRLETLFLDGTIAMNDWTCPVNFDLPDPVPAVLPNTRKLDVRLRPRPTRGITYWPRAPAQACQLQYLRLENCKVRWWLDSLLAPSVPPLVELYIHFPQDQLRTQDIPEHLGRTLERFAFTDTTMPHDCLIPLLVASKQLQWLNLSRTLVDCDMFRSFLTPRHVGGTSVIAAVIVHGCQHLGVDVFACVQGYVTLLEVEASGSP